MKCPWQMTETRTEQVIDIYGRLIEPETKSMTFADCIEGECPFYLSASDECRRVKHEDNN